MKRTGGDRLILAFKLRAPPSAVINLHPGLPLDVKSGLDPRCSKPVLAKYISQSALGLYSLQVCLAMCPLPLLTTSMTQQHMHAAQIQPYPSLAELRHHLQGPVCALMMYASDASTCCYRYAGPITATEWLDQSHTATNAPTATTHNCYNLVSQVSTHSHYFLKSTFVDAIAYLETPWPELHITI
jgi:hypothetical protein